MSVLVKGMEMPNRCPCKLVGVGYDMYCAFVSGIPSRVQEYYECCEKGTRPDWCPLIEVPPHGRLIDADELLKLIDSCMFPSDMVTTRAVSMATNWIKEAPTVIPADKDGET